MRRSLHIGKEPSLQKIVVASALFHLIFITIIVIPLKSRDRQYKSYFVNIVSPSDLRKTSKSTATKAVKPKGKKKIAKVKTKTRRKAEPKKGVSLEPEKRVSKEISRLKAISTLEKQKKKKEQEAAQEREEEEAVAKAIEGIRQKRLISIAAQGEQPSSLIDAYSALLRQVILDEWIHPDFDKYLEVIVSFHVDKSGEVSSLTTVQSSGNTIFDQSAIKAIKKASPLPPPAVEDDVEIRFHNEIDKI
jgi:colicin import membrane protein